LAVGVLNWAHNQTAAASCRFGRDKKLKGTVKRFGNTLGILVAPYFRLGRQGCGGLGELDRGKI